MGLGVVLRIRVRDIRRATLSCRSGNEGWIGISPQGDACHLVVPVDSQIARGVMACNRPTDGTPFGGYTGWLYFRCAPYEDIPDLDEETRRNDQAGINAEALVRFLADHGISAIVVDETASETPGAAFFLISQEPMRCSGCGKDWEKAAGLLRDLGVTLTRYRACVDDFNRGSYVFRHECGGNIVVPVSRFARRRIRGKSLVGSHACPGFCHYETSLRGCPALCEGACYRRIAEKLGRKGLGRTAVRLGVENEPGLNISRCMTP